MDNNRGAGPLAVLHEEAQTRVLRFLWRSRAEWSGREIARKTGLSAPACHETLKKLDARGLVFFRRVSNVHLYRINPENYLVRNVFAHQFEAEAAMPKKVAALVKKFLVDSPRTDILAIVLFGSMARGTQRLGSDLDLLIVLPAKTGVKALESRVERLRDLLFKRFSIPLSPYIQTLSELRRKHRRKLPLIQEIFKDGRTIYGREIKELLS
ncbi:MAG: nucleotidyltransferase domain-containing protein [Elusimicrobia bacterium]|nr:nucleotidyltransferase domain-containing protein [Elusimicrobiota bacterium]